MKLYVCWGTFHTPRPGGHPCHNAHEALKRGRLGPGGAEDLRLGAARRRAQPDPQAGARPDRQNWVPVLVTDEDEVIQGSQKIVDWAQANPADGVRRA